MYKKSLKIPRGQSESVNRWRTDKTMDEKKGQKDKQQFTKHYTENKDQATRVQDEKKKWYLSDLHKEIGKIITKFRISDHQL